MTVPTGDTADQLEAYLASTRLNNQRTDATKHIDFRDLNCYLQDKTKAEQAWEHLQTCQNTQVSTKMRVDSYYQFISLLQPNYHHWFQLKLERTAGHKCLEFHFMQNGHKDVELASMKIPELAQRLDSEHEEYCQNRDAEHLRTKFETDLNRAEYTFDDSNARISYQHFFTTDGRTIQEKLEAATSFFDNVTIKEYCQNLGFQQLIHHFRSIRNDAYSYLHNLLLCIIFQKKSTEIFALS
ncbi:hypothetical protein D5018_10900 [Parashewanella curva]|uniref:Uncharacterized protein n=2 Tax=Parashewanella curva TaxID=2338552 RepID=A0A3L8PWB6_9GAMM|nr:hypothetical protein D5018_10900 [Parashewanella curva]